MRFYIVHWLAGFTSPELAERLAPTWFMCVACAGLVALALSMMLARRRGIDRATVATIALWGYVAAVAAGIVVPAAIETIEHLVTTGHLHVHWAGMTSFWGYLAGTAAIAFVCRREHVSLARIGDLAAIPIGAALVLARLGCFLAGCDYGKPSTLPWAVRFPAGSPAWRDHLHAGLISADSPTSLAVHPTELYESLLGVVMIAVALVAARRVRRDGDLFLVTAATYAIGRLGIELVRGDAERGLYAGVSSGQIFCLVVLAAIVATVSLRARSARRCPSAAG